MIEGHARLYVPCMTLDSRNYVSKLGAWVVVVSWWGLDAVRDEGLGREARLVPHKARGPRHTRNIVTMTTERGDA